MLMRSAPLVGAGSIVLFSAALLPVCGAFLPTCAASAQAAAEELKPKDVADKGSIESVVLYRSRAAVTRVVRRELGQGLWAVRIGGLPASVQGQSLQAKVMRAKGSSAGAPKLLSVEFAQNARAEFSGSPEGVALANKLQELRRKLEYLKQDDAQADLQLKLVEQIGVRATANATHDGGTQALNLDAVRTQLEFVSKERARIVELRRAFVLQAEELTHQIQAAQQEFDARGGADRMDREAVVIVAAPEAGAVEVSLTYVVGQATWEPVYNIRAAGDRTGVEIEYDAMITQNTGEDWKDVHLSLSTAQPTRASAPPPVSPWFVDVYVPPVPASGMTLAFKAGEPASPAAPMEADAAASPMPAQRDQLGRKDLQEVRRAGIEKLAASAAVQETGIAVSFDLPRTLTVPTDEAKKQRTRIATVAPTASFVYTAQPIVTEDVFLRGDLLNSSGYQLLPGRAQIFMGGDFIGETGMPSVAPKDEFKVFFGPDRALRARRQLVAKTTGASGFFGGNEATTWNYRVSIDNGSGKDAKVELFDRRPLSRNEKIVATLSNLSRPLSTDKAYVEGPMTQGILRWDLAVPASARGDAAMPVAWTVELARPKDMQTTPLPPD